jgi:hypothetical protein
MTTPKNTLNSERHHAHAENHLSITQHNEVHPAVTHFVNIYNFRATFFSDAFIKKVKDGNRKALTELQRHALPPTQMDLRQEFAKCLNEKIADDYSFQMADSKVYTLLDLKRLVQQWATIAEQALMESDPALADKLMTPAQWNAKSAFEVTFVSAMNELKDIKKTKLVAASVNHYVKWTITPLQTAIEQVKAVNPPGNALIGYGTNRISLSEAMKIAVNLHQEFRTLLEKY